MLQTNKLLFHLSSAAWADSLIIFHCIYPSLSTFSFYYIPLFLPVQSFRFPLPILQYRRIDACYLQFFPIPSVNLDIIIPDIMGYVMLL